MMIAGSGSSTDINLLVGYLNNTHIAHSHWGTYYNSYVIPGYSSPIPRIHCFSLTASGGGKKYYLNNATDNPTSSDSYAAYVTSWAGSSLGRYNGSFYAGDIAEVIMFNRFLTNEERESIIKYLSKKYAITVTG